MKLVTLTRQCLGCNALSCKERERPNLGAGRAKWLCLDGRDPAQAVFFAQVQRGAHRSWSLPWSASARSQAARTLPEQLREELTQLVDLARAEHLDFAIIGDGTSLRPGKQGSSHHGLGGRRVPSSSTFLLGADCLDRVNNERADCAFRQSCFRDEGVSVDAPPLAPAVPQTNQTVIVMHDSKIL